jgi:ribonuclease-3
VSDDKVKSNQRLEYLGDSVLSVIVAEELYTALPDFDEGKLTKIRAGLVCEGALYDNALDLSLADYITAQPRDLLQGSGRKAILADAFEAVVGAMYLDGGFNAAKALVKRFLPKGNELRAASIDTKDFKTALQEYIQQTPGNRLEYTITGEDGPAHNRLFSAQVCLIGSLQIRLQNRLKAEQKREQQHTSPPQSHTQTHSPEKNITKLPTAQSEYNFSDNLFKYTPSATVENIANELSFKETSIIGVGVGNSKKQAEQQAARNALWKLTGNA